MKKILLVFILSCIKLYSIEYNSYPLEVEHVFNSSFKGKNHEDDLASDFFTAQFPKGPLIYFDEEELVIGDQARKDSRTIYLNDNYGFNRIYDYSFFQAEIISFNNFFVGYNYYSIITYDNTKGWEKISKLKFRDFPPLLNFKDLYYQDNTVFVLSNTNVWYAFKEPGLDYEENFDTMINEEEIIEAINNGEYEGLTIDDNKRLFLNGELQTINYNTFTKYWLEKQKILDLPKPNVNFTMTIDDLKTGSEDLLGIDSDGNSYWSSWNTDIAVFDKNGFLIELFVVSREKSSTNPAISPDGDVYFLQHEQDKITLYKIARQW